MACISLAFLLNLLIWAIVLGAVYALIKLVLPMALNALGTPGAVLAQALNIVLWAAIAIIVVIFVFDLISCLLGSVRIGR